VSLKQSSAGSGYLIGFRLHQMHEMQNLVVDDPRAGCANTAEWVDILIEVETLEDSVEIVLGVIVVHRHPQRAGGFNAVFVILQNYFGQLFGC